MEEGASDLTGPGGSGDEFVKLFRAEPGPSCAKATLHNSNDGVSETNPAAAPVRVATLRECCCRCRM